ncbi:hypothetical protein [Natronogracilivirga saccharolytica]|uniref:Uncharacterized protein n=1 Tax=Natronogracilivirga saccharolytica TaxID=2812953 RepID=A0A8J7UT96_9BACT|nr:hypothetical protein [Natronogracilivirga saccharolytica]MBP3191120.1 hypothetical protein [Natronogracilivirga saccharolytica]
MATFFKTLSLAFIGLLMAVTGNALAQVTIAPTALFIDDTSRFGTFIVINGSSQTQEVSLSFQFGYPDTDENGQSFMNYDDEQAREKYSMADWVRVFPRSFTLEPDERQTVRMTVRPPQDIADGTYWTRIKTASNPAVPDIDDEVTDGVQAQITFRFEQVTAGFYKHGDVNTGVEIKAVDVKDSGNQKEIEAEVVRTGNSPFLGSMFLTVRNSDDEVVYERRKSTTVYMDVIRRMAFDTSEFSSGEYSAEVRFESQRPDISSRDIVQTTPVTETVSFRISE